MIHTAIAKAARPPSLLLDFNGNPQTNDIPQPWNIRLRGGKAGVGIVRESGENVLHLRCKESSFSVERDASVDIRESPFVSWTWKALRVPPRGDVREKRYNDQALQILFAFENRKILSYIWDTNAPVGTITDESIGWPINLTIKVIVVQSGTLDIGRWIRHTRNIYEDYIHIFHEEPPHINGVRIQTNTQYTKDIAEGFVKSILFEKKFSLEAQKHASPAN